MKKLLSLILACGSIFAFSAKQNVQSLTLTGKIGVYGNEPHTYVAIKDSNNNLYRIENAIEYNLYKMQNRTVKIKALKTKENLGPGFPATIKVLELIK